MKTGTILIICYCIQIPLLIVGAFFLPMRGQLPRPYENLRKNGMILFGILPCAFFSVLIQLIALGVWMAKVSSIRNKGHKGQRALDGIVGNTGSVSSGGNPFGGAGSGSRPAPAGENPFGSAGGSSSAPNPGPNPFGTEPGGPSGPAPDNPFA